MVRSFWQPIRKPSIRTITLNGQAMRFNPNAVKNVKATGKFDSKQKRGVALVIAIFHADAISVVAQRH